MSKSLSPRPFRRALPFLGLACTALLLAACAKSAPPPKPKPLDVVVEKARIGDLPLSVPTLGTAQAVHTVTIIPQISGILQQVLVRSGQTVQRGQLLFAIDPAPEQATLAQDAAKLQGDKANLAYEQGQVQAYRPLLPKGYVTTQTYDQTVAQAEQAAAAVAEDKAAIASAQIQLGYTQIRAPISGRIGLLSTKSGNLISANSTSLGSITQLQPIDIQFSLPQRYLPDLLRAVQSGQDRVSLYLDGKEPVGQAPVTAVDNSADSSSGTISARATWGNHPIRLWPGEYVQLRFHYQTLRQVVLVPRNALQEGVNGPFVYSIRDGHAVTIPVHYLGTQNDLVAVSGLQGGISVIYDIPAHLHSGTPVQVLRQAPKALPKAVSTATSSAS
ncbi:MAG: efflux RND transporter periplasmic adaptor subunit [Candidatus Igneacidithiobacillus chanchocoensis]